MANSKSVVAFVGCLLALALLVSAAQAAPHRAEAAQKGAPVQLADNRYGPGFEGQNFFNPRLPGRYPPRAAQSIPDRIVPARLDLDDDLTIDDPITPDPASRKPAQRPMTRIEQQMTCDPNNPECQNGDSCAGCQQGCSSTVCSPQMRSARRTRMVSYAAGGACAAGACGAAAFGSRGGRGPVRRVIRNRPRLFGRLFGRGR